MANYQHFPGDLNACKLLKNRRQKVNILFTYFTASGTSIDFISTTDSPWLIAMTSLLERSAIISELTSRTSQPISSGAYNTNHALQFRLTFKYSLLTQLQICKSIPQLNKLTNSLPIGLSDKGWDNPHSCDCTYSTWGKLRSRVKVTFIRAHTLKWDRYSSMVIPPFPISSISGSAINTYWELKSVSTTKNIHACRQLLVNML